VIPFVANLNAQVEFAGRQADVFRDATETAGYSVVNLRTSYALVYKPGRGSRN